MAHAIDGHSFGLQYQFNLPETTNPQLVVAALESAWGNCEYTCGSQTKKMYEVTCRLWVKFVCRVQTNDAAAFDVDGIRPIITRTPPTNTVQASDAVAVIVDNVRVAADAGLLDATNQVEGPSEAAICPYTDTRWRFPRAAKVAKSTHRQLQARAKARGIKANESAAVLKALLDESSSGGGSDAFHCADKTPHDQFTAPRVHPAAQARFSKDPRWQLLPGPKASVITVLWRIASSSKILLTHHLYTLY